jgi:hypothetical protein
MPALISNWQEKSYSTANEVFLNRMREATRIMNINEKLSGYSTTEAFVDELVKNLKVIKVCKTNPYECFAPEIINAAQTETVRTDELRTAKDFGIEDYDTNLVGLTLVNGYNIILAYNLNCPSMEVTAARAETTGCLSMVYDINSKAKPNKMSKDVQGLNIGNIFNTCDGHKFSFGCLSTSDMSSGGWSHAMNACASVGMRLPTIDELEEMYVYEMSNNTLGMKACTNGIGCCNYWSSTEDTIHGASNYAWSVQFKTCSGDPGLRGPTTKGSVRAVRCIK